MHESHARVGDIVVGIVAEMPCKRIDKRAVIVAVSGMHHESRLLVDHKQIVVLIHDVDRYILRYDFAFVARTVHHYRHDIEGLYAVVGFYGIAVDKDTSRLRGLLYAVARGFLHPLHKKFIHTQQSLPLVGDKTEMLVARAAVVGVVKVVGVALLHSVGTYIVSNGFGGDII